MIRCIEWKDEESERDGRIGAERRGCRKGRTRRTLEGRTDRAEDGDGEATSSIRGPRDGWVEVLNDFGIKTLMAFVSFPRLRELFRNF